jgi:SapC
MNLRPLHPRDHGRLAFGPLPDWSFANRQGNVPIGLQEIGSAIADYPLVFIKHQETGQFRLVALLSLDAEGSWYSLNGHWQATYLPLNIRRHPFYLAGPGADGATLGLAIDETSPALRRIDEAGPAGEPLFNPDGAPTEATQRMAQTLARLREDAAAAAALIDKLVKASLLVPLSIAMHAADGAVRHVEGLYGIDADALARVPDAVVLALHRSGELGAAHAIAASLAHLERLRQLHNARKGAPIVRLRVSFAAH